MKFKKNASYKTLTAVFTSSILLLGCNKEEAVAAPAVTQEPPPKTVLSNDIIALKCTKKDGEIYGAYILERNRNTTFTDWMDFTRVVEWKADQIIIEYQLGMDNTIFINRKTLEFTNYQEGESEESGICELMDLSDNKI